MAAKQKSGITQEQALKLTPQMVVILGNLLEKNEAEMADRANQELVENPALERKDDHAEESTQATEDGETYKESAEDLQKNDYGDEDERPTYHASNRSGNSEWTGPTAVSETSLSEYLMSQMRERQLGSDQLRVAEYIVGNLDDNGYLQRNSQAIADDITFNAGFEVERKEVDKVLNEIRQLDPAGIAATDLSDCILLQLKRNKPSRLNDLAIVMIEKHFNEYANHHYDKICALMEIDSGTLEAMNNIVKKVNPKPGSAYSGGSSDIVTQQITPDFEVEVDDDSHITVSLLNRMPELQISKTYLALNEQYSGKKAKNANEEEVMANVRTNYRRASDFMMFIKMRQQRLFKTMSAIVNRQKEFFLTGDDTALRPMVLKEIADDTGYDVSTISRSTQNKYVTTPWGIFSLKHFFSEGLGDVSTRTIKNALKKLIDEEDKCKPLSDDKLCSTLQQAGFEVQRRTVAKYRNQLEIPVARLRKQVANKETR